MLLIFVSLSFSVCPPSLSSVHVCECGCVCVCVGTFSHVSSFVTLYLI